MIDNELSDPCDHDFNLIDEGYTSHEGNQAYFLTYLCADCGIVRKNIFVLIRTEDTYPALNEVIS